MQEFCSTLLLNICGGCFFLTYNCSISTSSQHLMILPARNLAAWFSKKTGPRFIHDDAGIVTKVDGILNSPTDAVCCSDTCSIDLGDPCILQGCILGWSSNGGFKPPLKKNTMKHDVTYYPQTSTWAHHQTYQAVFASDVSIHVFGDDFYHAHSIGQGSKVLL